MAHTFAAVQESSRVNSLDSARTPSAPSTRVSQSSQLPLTALIPEACRRAGCSMKEAAIAMEIDPAQAHRQLANGHLTAERIDRLPGRVKAELFKLGAEEYGTLTTPKAHGHRLLSEIDQRVSELRQLIDTEVA